MAEDSGRVGDLIEGAYAEGELSRRSTQALASIGDQVGVQLARALGDQEPKDDDLLLAAILIDDSPSIGSIVGGAEAVMQGHNYCLEALEDELPSDILVLTRCLNAGTLWPFRGLIPAPRLSPENYGLKGDTPLYQESVLTLGAVMAKAREERQRGRRVRAFSLIVTDGENYASNAVTAQEVSFLASDMLEFSDDYKVAGMGIGSPERFRTVFRSMGIPEDWILTAPASAEQIRRLFRRIAKTLRLAASGDDGWRQLEAGPPPDDS